jgi:Protein kinase domain/Leucine rich repeat
LSVSPDQLEMLAQLKAGKLNGATRLSLSCNLTQFPPEIFDLADTLEILDLSGNALSSLPDDFNRLSKLKILFCSSNQFTEFPMVLGQSKTLRMIGFKHNQIKTVPPEALPTATLRWLILTDNQLETLPETLGDCINMQKLMLAGNQLIALPKNLKQCQQLELLRISANQFTELPAWLFTLPKLAWLAYAGNPFCHSNAQETAIKAIDWHALTLGEVLGQGASGVTYRAELRDDEYAGAVAVKLFKGQVTSDGLPEHEMQASLKVGLHPHLVGALGAVTHHPDGLNGLVMSMLNPDLQVLARPPSFETCTRDVYQSNVKLTANQAVHIAQGVASAMHHLHQQGILHGDLYAHNILWNNQQVVLTDLGGASFFDEQDTQFARHVKAIDQRAYQILLHELADLAETRAETLLAMCEIKAN